MEDPAGPFTERRSALAVDDVGVRTGRMSGKGGVFGVPSERARGEERRVLGKRREQTGG